MAAPRRMQTGENISVPIDTHHAALMASLVAVYLEYVRDDAFEYAAHHNQNAVGLAALVRSLQYNLIDEQGCMKRMKDQLVEAMQTGWVEGVDDETDDSKAETRHALLRYYTECKNAVDTKHTPKAAVDTIMEAVFSETKVEEVEEDPIDPDPSSACLLNCDKCRSMEEIHVNWDMFSSTVLDPTERRIAGIISQLRARQ